LKNVLIISHTFPPSPGIGGRRWAKFAKYLKRDDFKVQVIAAENILKKESQWKGDIKDLSIDYLPYSFPKVLTKSGLNFFDKLAYRFWKYLLMMLNRGNYYDRAFFWKNKIKRRIIYYVEHHQIELIIVTGAPFLLTYYVMQMKKAFPHVKFAADFRDLWTTDTDLTSFSSLPAGRVNVEKKKEQFVVDTADFVFTVADTMTEYFKGISSKKNVFTLPNGFDPEDITGTEMENKRALKELNFVFAGTLYHNLNKILVPFLEALSKLKTNNKEIYETLHIKFYGLFPKEYLKLLEYFNLTDVIKVKGEVGLTEAYKKIAKADACLLILNDAYNFSLSTKFCEYIGFRKKIIVVSSKKQPWLLDKSANGLRFSCKLLVVNDK
jgi:glycosyltransferase involved in cell wall biosynthesis